MTRRFLLGLTAALLLQGTVFALYYDDLLYLRQPVGAIVGDGPDTFSNRARAALGRDRLTVRHLDTIAEAAATFGLHEIEVLALERRREVTPSDRQARLRLGDALRRAGRLVDAETLYLDLLSSNDTAAP